MSGTHRVDIFYCTQCRWLLRSAWMAQELLTTFEQDLASVSLNPGTGGIFEVHVNSKRIWSRAEDGGFPDIKTLKQRVRDEIDPERPLGHVDGHSKVAE